MSAWLQSFQRFQFSVFTTTSELSWKVPRDDCGKPFFFFLFPLLHHIIFFSIHKNLNSHHWNESRLWKESSSYLEQTLRKSKSLTTYFMQTRFFAWMCFKTTISFISDFYFLLLLLLLLCCCCWSSLTFLLLLVILSSILFSLLSIGWDIDVDILCFFTVPCYAHVRCTRYFQRFTYSTKNENINALLLMYNN